VVFTYEGKGAFGELALMYNCPRAATVQVTPSLSQYSRKKSAVMETGGRVVQFQIMEPNGSNINLGTF